MNTKEDFGFLKKDSVRNVVTIFLDVHSTVSNNNAYICWIRTSRPLALIDWKFRQADVHESSFLCYGVNVIVKPNDNSKHVLFSNDLDQVIK